MQSLAEEVSAYEGGLLHAVAQKLLVFAAGDMRGEVADLPIDIGDLNTMQVERIAQRKVDHDCDTEYDQRSLNHGNPLKILVSLRELGDWGWL